MHPAILGTMRRKLSFLLRAFIPNGGATDGALSAAQVLDTAAAEGVLDGSLTVVDSAAGTVAIAANKLSIVGSNTWGHTGVYGARLVKAIGQALLGKFQWSSDQADVFAFGFNGAAQVGGSGDFAFCGYNTANTLRVDIYDNGASIASIAAYGALAINTDYQILHVQGGYNAAGVPYKTGDTKADFTYGGAVFFKGGVFTNWTLLYRIGTITTNEYPIISVKSNLSTVLADKLLIPDYDFSSLLQPTVLDTFTGVDGTSLADHTPDVGGGWTHRKSSFTISSNRALSGVATATNDVIATQDAGIADYMVDFVARIRSDPNSYYCGHELRLSPVDNSGFFSIIRGDTGGFELFEDDGAGNWTSRGSYAAGVAYDTDYSIRSIVSGATIKSFINNALGFTYASATRNQTSTHVGVWARAQGNQFDNFSVFPLTSIAWGAKITAGTGGLY